MLLPERRSGSGARSGPAGRLSILPQVRRAAAPDRGASGSTRRGVSAGVVGAGRPVRVALQYAQDAHAAVR